MSTSEMNGEGKKKNHTFADIQPVSGINQSLDLTKVSRFNQSLWTRPKPHGLSRYELFLEKSIEKKTRFVF